MKLPAGIPYRQRRMARRLAGHVSDIASAILHSPGEIGLQSPKLRAIDALFSVAPPDTLADLGSMWVVEGGYGTYAADRYGLRKVFLVDDKIEKRVRSRLSRRSDIELLEGSLGSDKTRSMIGHVGAVLLFDVLLHQVDPDWTELLSMWAPLCDSMVVAGPWYRGECTVRLTDLEFEEYIRTVPDVPLHHFAYQHLDEQNEERGRLWRDVHDIWQWGIAPKDLLDRMSSLGFVLVYQEQSGDWRGLAKFESATFVFTRRAQSGTKEQLSMTTTLETNVDSK